MKVLDPGHKYKLLTLDGSLRQILTFVKRKDKKGENRYPGNKSAYPGTNIQDVIRCLLDRLRYLDAQVPCREDKLIITRLQEILYLLELRAAERHGRVLDCDSVDSVEDYEICKKCGHIQCNLNH